MNRLNNLKPNRLQVFTLLTLLIGVMNIHAQGSSWMPFILVCTVFGSLLIAGMISIVLRKKEH